MMNINNETTDEEIVLCIQQGDKEKFGIIMDRYQNKLLRYGRKFISEIDRIEDIVQDIFIRSYENIMSFDVARQFSPWIYRIAHNIFINDMKKKKSIPFHVFDFDTILPHHQEYEENFPKKIIDEEIKNLIDEGLKNLSLGYKEVLILYYMEDLSYKEIADVLEVPVGTVGIRLKRAKASLKKQIPNDILDK